MRASGPGRRWPARSIDGSSSARRKSPSGFGAEVCTSLAAASPLPRAGSSTSQIKVTTEPACDANPRARSRPRLFVPITAIWTRSLGESAAGGHFAPNRQRAAPAAAECPGREAIKWTRHLGASKGWRVVRVQGQRTNDKEPMTNGYFPSFFANAS